MKQLILPETELRRNKAQQKTVNNEHNFIKAYTHYTHTGKIQYKLVLCSFWEVHHVSLS